MKKAAVRETQTTTVAQDDIERSLLALVGKRQFVNASVNMGWQLGLTVIVPVFIGVKLDDHFHSAPSYTLTALFLAAMGAGMVVYKTVRDVSAKTEKEKPVK